MINAVIFDFDHTLYDRRATYVKMLDAYEEVFGDVLAKDRTRGELLDMLCRIDHKSMRFGMCDWPDIYRAQVEAGVFGNPPTEEAFIDMIYSRYPGCIVLFEDTLSTLTVLKNKGYKLGLLSNGTSGFQRDKINASGIVPYLDGIVVSGEVGYPKPHPYTFTAIAGKLSVRPEECAFVGDNPTCDICGARGVGMTPVWMHYNHDWPAEYKRPDYEICRLSDLPNVVDGVNGKNK